jgi:anti-anti-sigma regulatory factor
MDVSVTTEEGRVAVTVMTVVGDIDASSYRDLIAKGREQFAAGARNLLLDLSGVKYVGSAGLVALHSLAVLMRGAEPPDPEAGWRAFRTMGRDVASGPQKAVKLLGPQEAVQRVLDTSGMIEFFEVYRDRAEAVASF